MAEEPQRDIQLQGADYPVGEGQGKRQQKTPAVTDVEMNQPVFHVVNVMEKILEKTAKPRSRYPGSGERGDFVTLDQKKQEDTRRKGDETGPGDQIVGGRQYVGCKHEAKSGDKKYDQGQKVRGLGNNERGRALAVAHAEVFFKKDCLYRLATHGGQRRCVVNGLANHADFPNFISV